MAGASQAEVEAAVKQGSADYTQRDRDGDRDEIVEKEQPDHDRGQKGETATSLSRVGGGFQSVPKPKAILLAAPQQH